jgi:thiosulfate/3-mercaptopyruvate sulfurtransferase
MTFTSIISTFELARHLAERDWVILDCRFTLAEPQRGEQEYLRVHIPGAVYLSLDRDLSGPVIPGVTGRHPLPAVEAAAETFTRAGIGKGVKVAAYDDAGGALAAARAWWMLRWLGHAEVAVLNGGWQLWQKEGRLVRAGMETRQRGDFTPRVRGELLTSAEQVDQLRLDPAYRVFDSRSADRYRGENETIDPVAGHIPGAGSAPYAVNLQSDGRFRPKDSLHKRFSRLTGEVPTGQCIFYCGSGVTAAHNILAMEYAGLGEARLYAGSWSEWITDPKRPVAKGER